MLREVKTLRKVEECHPTEQDVWDALNFANENHCTVELKWFIPHYGWKVWVIDPGSDIQNLLSNLHLLV